jgi:hypothetical protein
MKTPTVTEQQLHPEPVTLDTFISEFPDYTYESSNKNNVKKNIGATAIKSEVSPHARPLQPTT